MNSKTPTRCKYLTPMSFPSPGKPHVSLFVTVNNWGCAIRQFMCRKQVYLVKVMWPLTLQDILDHLNIFGCLISGLLVDTLVLCYCGKMPSSPSFHPLLSLLDISFIWNVIITLICLAACVIKCFKVRCIWMLYRSWPMIKCVWEVPVWCYQLFAAWQRFHQKQTLFSLWIWTAGFEKRP